MNACGREPSPSATTSSEAEYQSPHELPSRLVRTCTTTPPASAGGRQMTPTSLKRRPGSMVTASSADASRRSERRCVRTRRRSPVAPRPAARADRAIVWVRTSGVRTHAATASLARGASQMAASVAMKVSMQMVAARATRLWG